jgi:hypothetical protein
MADFRTSWCIKVGIYKEGVQSPPRAKTMNSYEVMHSILVMLCNDIVRWKVISKRKLAIGKHGHFPSDLSGTC